MKAASVVLAIVASVAGLRAAYLWYRASRVQIEPLWAQSDRIEPVDRVQAQSEWLYGIFQASNTSADLNRRAAKWTAVAVALSTAATLAGSI